MAISQRIMEAHGGYISVAEEALGTGATFVLELPVG
jgi:signal transduction histidine kinase